MITIRLKGGMGNQMFQYAFAKGIAKKLNTTFEIDCSLLLDRSRGKEHIYRNYDLSIFNVEQNFHTNPDFLSKIYKLKSSVLRKYLTGRAQKGKTYLSERHFHTDQELLNNPIDNALYDGWWQSARYFENVNQELLKDFTFKNDFSSSSKDTLARINDSNAVCLNVRRTDFLNNPTLNSTNLEYFLNAARKMSEITDNPHFFVFSDDIEWCKQNIKLDFPVEVVPHIHKGVKFSNYLNLMTKCKHYIIPNSSFAWWAVWLNQNRDRHVIAPKNWFSEGNYDTTDLIPKEWIKI